MSFHGERILRVSTYFDKPLRWERIIEVAENMPSEKEFRISAMRLFCEHGYRVVRDGEPDENNPHDIGFYVYGSHDPVWTDERIAAQTGVSMPRKYRYDEVLLATEPIVAKEVGSDGGVNKFLLEDEEQKVKFLTWMLLGQSLGRLWKFGENMEDAIASLMRMISNNDFSSEYFFLEGEIGALIDLYKFQSYVEHPGDRYTTLRVVVDCFGRVHYSEVFSSKHMKGLKTIVEPVSDINMDIMKAVAIPGMLMFSELLNDPSSPFFLNSQNILSSGSENDGRILLDGTPKRTKPERRVLADMGVDPSRPLLPEELALASSRIGRAAKNIYPFVGLDFIRSPDQKYLFLELNPQPELNHVALGVDNIRRDQILLEMMSRVAMSGLSRVDR